MDFKREITDTAKYIIIGLTLAFVINLTLGYALGTEKPAMAVVSNSMVPEFSKGDLIVVKGAEPQEIEVGDVIVYRNPYRNKDIVHRVIDIKKEDGRLVFYTKGDNNMLDDQSSKISPPVEEEWIKGKYLFHIPKLGWLKVLLVEMLGKI